MSSPAEQLIEQAIDEAKEGPSSAAVSRYNRLKTLFPRLEAAWKKGDMNKVKLNASGIKMNAAGLWDELQKGPGG
jgi:hypothetical protein